MMGRFPTVRGEEMELSICGVTVERLVMREYLFAREECDSWAMELEGG